MGVSTSADRAIDATAALRELFLAEYTRTVALASLLGAADPEDVAQEAFARLHSKLVRLRDQAAAGAYLRTTVVNLTRTSFARNVMKRRVLTAAGTRLDAPASHVSAEDDALGVIGEQWLAAAIAGLPRKQREAIVLRYWLDLSVADIAETMGIPLPTAKSHLSRALAGLRKHLSDKGESTDA